MRTRTIPVIDVTDLYYPAQDPGDNFDLAAAFGLPEVDLRAVILDVTGKFRNPYTHSDNLWERDVLGVAKEPGVIPVTQLNCLFDRHVPYGIGPFGKMRSPLDPMTDAPPFQQTGIELLLSTLREADEPIDVLSFGSARTIAAAYNRDPDLLRGKVKRVHLCAGASSPDFLEWNVLLDPSAIVRLLRSDLPVALYPCATADGPFAYGEHNTYWLLDNLRLLERLSPGLRRYLGCALSRSHRIDFLRVLVEDMPEQALEQVMNRSHHVWETAVWMEVTGRKLARYGGGWELVPAPEVAPGDEVVACGLRPCRVSVADNGAYSFELTDEYTGFWVYERKDPYLYELALREALPRLYASFLPRGGQPK